MRRLLRLVAAVGIVAGLLAVPGILPAGSAPTPAAVPLPPAASSIAATPIAAPSTAERSTAPTAPAPTPAGPGPAVEVEVEDARAGLLSTEVPPVGSGALVVVPGSAPAPGPGPVRTVRIEVEGGLPVAPESFAVFVMDALNDPRGWGRGGAMSFARTDGDADLSVVLASPETSVRLCVGLDTRGTLSCRVGNRAVLTHHRWVLAHPDYGPDRTGYRRYVVNHEVGHVLGHGHVPCPGPGVPAPVMMQQTKGLLGCTPNPWPNP